MLEAIAALARAAADDATATPSPVPTVDPSLVTPGPAGFIVIALLALAAVALIWDMQRRIRRGRVRADINEELDAEELSARQGRAAERASDVDDQDIDVPDEDDGPSRRR